MDAAVAHLRKHWFDYTKYLLQQGFFDDRFVDIKELQDKSSPDCVIIEVFSNFFQTCDDCLNNMASFLAQKVVNFKQLGDYAHRLKGTSHSVGARRVKNVCIIIKANSDAQNLEECLRYLPLVQQECYLVKINLEKLITLEKQIIAAGGSIPVMERILPL